jgi:peptidoglycan/LPS O-acetylase OafA/YrhL
MQAERKAPHLSYRPGLDGLRAIAVAAVFLYHARPHASGSGYLPGGFLGVDLFFVLSGYLITSLLLVEWEARGRIDLRRFWLRRARRLFPAVVVVVLAALVLAAVFARDVLSSTRGDALSSLFYYTNWHEILANHSYFARMGRPSLLQHLWSLAVEEQFYVVWPLLLVAALVVLGRKRLPLLVVAGIAGSTTLMWLLYNPYGDPSRVYYGTDTRAQELLVGILLALAWPLVERIRRRIPLLDLVGLAALVGTIVIFRTVWDFEPRLYRGGMLAYALVFVVLIGVVAHPQSRLGPALGIAPLRWVGERSYGMYLWHWPVIALMRPGVDVSWTGPQLVVVQAAVVVVAAALSYRFVEQPIRSGRLQRRLAQVQLRRRLELVGAGTVALVASFCVLFVTPSALSPVALYVNPPPARAATPAQFEPGRFLEPNLGGTQKPPKPKTKHKTKPTAPAADRILAIGDSVMLGCTSQLATALHHRARIDATVGRQIDDTITDLDRYRARHQLPRTVVIQIGNNGPLWYRDLVRLRQALRGVQNVIVVNVRNATSWEQESNHAIANWVKSWRAAHVADWYGHSKDSMLSDGTHPWPSACTIYARLIAATVRSAA